MIKFNSIKMFLVAFILLIEVAYGVDISEKEELWVECNKDNNIQSCFEFAEFYYRGVNREIYDKEYYKVVREPFQKACDNGVAKACSRLGEIYTFAQGVKSNHPKGCSLHDKACDMGASWSCIWLGWYSVINLNDTKAIKYFEKGCALKAQNSCEHRDEILEKIQKLNMNQSE